MSEDRTSVSASATIPDTSPMDAYEIMATPANWPDLFLFAQEVEAVDGADSKAPMRKGTRIREQAGVFPILNELNWVATLADPRRGMLELASDGNSVLDNLGAKDAKLTVSVASDGASGSNVEVGASFIGEGPLAALVPLALGFEVSASASLLFPWRLKDDGGDNPKNVFALGLLTTVYFVVLYGFFVVTGDVKPELDWQEAWRNAPLAADVQKLFR